MQLISNRGNCVKYNITDAASVLEVFTRHKLSRQSLLPVVFPVHSNCSAPFLKYLPSSRTAGLIRWVGFPPISGQPLEFGLDSFSKALSSPRLKDAPQSTHSTSVAASLKLIRRLWEFSFAGQFGHQENKPSRCPKHLLLRWGHLHGVS